MATEFNDASHYGFFMTGTTLTSATGKYIRVSELALAALRAQGVFDNLVDGTSPPATDKLWLDKNTDPAVLKEWDATGSAWVPMTFERLFGRAIVTPMATPTGTGNAVVVAAPSPFIPNRMYSLTPIADNSGAVTIQVTGVSTFNVTYTDGSALDAQEFKDGNPTILLFTGTRFEVLFKVADVYAARDQAVAAAAALPPITPDTMLVDNAGGTARETKSFSQVRSLFGVFATLADFLAATNLPATPSVVVLGYNEAGDMGGRRLVLNAGPLTPAPWRFNVLGRWWEDAEDNDITVEQFGAVSYTAAELVALNGAASIGVQASVNDTAFSNALARAKDLKGRKVHGKGDIYPRMARTLIPSATTLGGKGKLGEWDVIFPGRPKTHEGSTLLYMGTGAKTETFLYITSMEHGGGWRTVSGTPRKLTSFYLANAAGVTPATQRQFSVCVSGENEAQGWAFEDFRVLNWIGTDGISDHSNPATSSLGDAWDIGLLVKDGEYCKIENVQAVGYFREFGHLYAITGSGNSRGERSRISNCKFQGRVGWGIRAPDRWAASAPSSTTIQLYASAEEYFASAGTARGSDNVTYTWTGKTKVGTVLTLTGVTPNPQLAHSGTGIFQLRHPSAGIANTLYDNVLAYGLDHISGVKAGVLGLNDSKAFEASGFPLRGLKMVDCKVHSREDVLYHVHDVQDIGKFSFQFEGGGYVIASPSSTEATTLALCAAPVGETRNLRIIDCNGLLLQNYITTMLARNGLIDELQIGRGDVLTTDLVLQGLRAGGEVILREGSGIERLNTRQQIVTTAGFGFVTVTSQTCTFRYLKYGGLTFFSMVHTWSGLDTTDTSAISIRLPVDASANALFNAVINDRRSTGINLAGVDNPYVDLATDNYLGISRSDSTRLAYNGGQIAAAGELHIAGCYWND